MVNRPTITPEQAALKEERKRFRQLIAACDHPNAFPEALRNLSEVTEKHYFGHLHNAPESWKAAELLAAHPNTPLDVLKTWLPYTQEAFLTNPILPLLSLEAPEFFDNISYSEKMALLMRAETPLFLVRLFAASADEEVAQAAKQHIAIAGEAGEHWRTELQAHLETLPLTDTSAYLVMAALGLLPEWLAKRVAELPEPTIPPYVHKVSVPKREYVLPESPLEPPPDGWASLLKLSEAERTVQARNPFLPEEALLLLAEDKRESVRCTVAQNPAATAQVLEICAKRSSLTIQLYIAVHPAASTDLLITLCKTSDQDVQLAVLSRSSLPRTVLRAIALPTPTVMLGILRHPSARQKDGSLYPALRKDLVRRFWEFWGTTPMDELLHYFALRYANWSLPYVVQSSEWLTRLAAVQNPKTSIKIRARLAEQDGNRFVRAAARASIATAEKALQSTVDA
jgi:hypothetical protein